MVNTSVTFKDGRNYVYTKFIRNNDNSYRIPSVGEFVKIDFKGKIYHYKVLSIETIITTDYNGELSDYCYEIGVKQIK